MRGASVPALGENCYGRRMTQASHHTAPTGQSPFLAPAVRPIAQGRDWSMAEYICHAGPGDRAFEEQHAAFTIAAVASGSFRYRADTGTSLLHPGAVLLGNAGTCFECGHDHSRGDHCIALHVGPDYFAEVAASAGGTMRYRFRMAMLPAGAASLPWLVRLQTGIARADPCETEEAVTQLLERVITASSGATPTPQRISASDEQRISASLQTLERDFAGAISLDQLAGAAAMSKYHYLRTFRRIVGSTPYQYLLWLRLWHAALRLARSATPVLDIVFDAGFGDFSTFITRFRRQFGMSPSRYRARFGKRRATG